MNISFTGVNNIIYSRSYNSRNGLYADNNGNLVEGKKNYTTALVSADLTDDVTGSDLSDFRKAINSSEPLYQANCINYKNPNKIKFEVKSFIADDKSGLCSKAMFKLNDYYIFIKDRQNIPLFEYLAKFTKKLSSQVKNERQKSILEFINSDIAREVSRFIEHI